MRTRRRSRTREVVLILGLSAIAITPFLVYVNGHFQIVEASYDMEALQSRRAELEHENRALRLARARLMSLPRIEREAAALGLVQVSLGRLVTVAPPGAAHQVAQPPGPIDALLTLTEGGR